MSRQSTRQLPPEHTSAPLHILASSQEFVLSLTNTQPEAGLHESSVHGLLSLQVSGVPAWQFPSARQTSAPLQASPSAHELVTSGVNAHPVDALQESSVHGLLSLQVSGVPATHAPAARGIRLRRSVGRAGAPGALKPALRDREADPSPRRRA